ncbi:MAG: DUF4194 domain-containing protein [Corynebacterium sp.]|nr:DUF4194 domain-containing protein [Corynebacterium sp.]
MTNNVPMNHNDQNLEGKHHNAGENASFPVVPQREIESPTRHQAELAYTERYFTSRTNAGVGNANIIKADIMEAEIIDAEVLDVKFDDDNDQNDAQHHGAGGNAPHAIHGAAPAAEPEPEPEAEPEPTPKPEPQDDTQDEAVPVPDPDATEPGAYRRATAPESAEPAPEGVEKQPEATIDNDEELDWLEDDYAHDGLDISGLWEADAGTLSFDSRRALVQLLQGPLVRAEQHPPIWKAILSDEAALRQRLSDMFLDLVVDEDAGIAFTRIANAGNPIRMGKEQYVDMPQVLRVKTLTIIDTVVLLDLRTRLGLAVPGERVIVDQEELRDNASQFRALDDKDEATFNRRFDASMERMRRDYSLLGDTETEGRFEVSPALKHIFDAQTVAGIKAEFEELLAREESK